MRRFLLIVTLFIGVMLGNLTTAQESTNEIDNECYTGGELEGKCTTEWDWTCGWYIRNWRNTGGPIPDWCHYQINPVPAASAVVNPPKPVPQYPSAGCVYNGPVYNDYTNFGGGWWLPINATIYTDANCQNAISSSWLYPVIYSPAPYDAQTLCQEAFGTSIWNNVANGTDIYLCNN